MTVHSSNASSFRLAVGTDLIRMVGSAYVESSKLTPPVSGGRTNTSPASGALTTLYQTCCRIPTSGMIVSREGISGCAAIPDAATYIM